MSDIIAFDYSGKSVRMIEKDGEPWWILADAMEVLGLSNPTMAVKNLDPDEWNTFNIGEGIRGNPNKIAVSESGIYSLILRSKRPEAKAFRRWITHEVLPSIRRTGQYKIDEEANRRALDMIRGALPLPDGALVSIREYMASEGLEIPEGWGRELFYSKVWRAARRASAASGYLVREPEAAAGKVPSPNATHFHPEALKTAFEVVAREVTA